MEHKLQKVAINATLLPEVAQSLFSMSYYQVSLSHLTFRCVQYEICKFLAPRFPSSVDKTIPTLVKTSFVHNKFSISGKLLQFVTVTTKHKSKCSQNHRRVDPPPLVKLREGICQMSKFSSLAYDQTVCLLYFSLGIAQ